MCSLTDRLHRAALAIAIATGAPRGALGQEVESAFWPELDVTWNINHRYAVGALYQNRHFEEHDERQQAAGVFGDLLHLPRWSVRAGYRHVWTEEESDPTTDENRGLVEYTVHSIGREASFVSRTRYEARWLDDGFSSRLRQRVQGERPLRIGKQRVTPFLSDEVFYDTRFGNIARNRARAGAKTDLKKNVSVEASYTRQDTYRDSVERVNAFAMTVGVTLH